MKLEERKVDCFVCELGVIKGVNGIKMGGSTPLFVMFWGKKVGGENDMRNSRFDIYENIYIYKFIKKNICIRHLLTLQHHT